MMTRKGRTEMAANHNAHHAPAPVGGNLFNATTFVCGVLIAIMIAILAVRIIFGLGAVTNLNDGYPWGIWVVVDGVIVALGRWWNFWHVFWPSYSNPNSVMFAVAVCISAYNVVMWLEFSPAVF